METDITFWLSPNATHHQCRLYDTIIKPYFHQSRKSTRTSPFSFKVIGEKIDASHNNIFLMAVTDSYYSRTGSLEQLDLSVDLEYIKKAYDAGMKCVIDYSWEAPPIIMTHINFWKTNKDIIQKYEIQLLSNVSSEENFKLESGKDFFLKFNLFQYEVRKTNSYQNIDYHLNTHTCRKEDKKHFFNFFVGDINKFKNVLAMASYFKRNLDKHSVYSSVIGSNTHSIKLYQGALIRYEEHLDAREDVCQDILDTFNYLEDHEDEIIAHMPFERYEGFPEFDVNATLGSNSNERRIPQLAHECHLWGVVETLSMYNTIHHTEKTFKPISVGLPFMILGSRNQNADLKRFGYEIFDEIIDYSFEQETTWTMAGATEKYFDEMERLIKEGPEIFYIPSVKEKCEWNKYNFEKLTTKDNLEKELKLLLS